MQEIEGVDAYINAVFHSHCPYLGLALQDGGIDIVDYTKVPDLVSDDLPGLGCLNAERLRECRRSQISARRRILVCAILIFPNAANIRQAVSKTHFILKVLFTGQGLLFGKFWPGQGLVGENGLAVPEPPLPVLVLRSSLARRDEHFFENKSRPFRDDYLCAEDDGEIVSGPFLRLAANELRAALSPDQAEASDDLQVSRAAYGSKELIKLLESNHGKSRKHDALAP